MGTGTKHDVLVNTDWLADHLGDPEVAVVEVDEDTEAYQTSHIPGAVSLNWMSELHDLPRRDFVTGERLAQLLGDKGVGSDQRIIMYGGNNNWFAAYAYWLCSYRGIDGVSLLDGGRVKWERESRPMTADVPAHGARQVRHGTDRPELRTLRDEAVTMAGDGAVLVDVRSPAEFSGELKAPAHLPQEQAYMAGHIPGAVNIPWSQAANEDGTFKSEEALRALYGGKGVGPDGTVVAYCRIGERSSHTWFVLHELLGYPDVRNYDGSWTEYGSLVGVPVAVGAG